MDIESIRIAEESARWGFWSMIAATISAIATAATAVIALLASRAWRKQERLNQLIKLKRAVFEYRVLLETIGSAIKSEDSRNDYIKNKLRPAGGRVLHELMLAGLDDKKSTQSILFNEVFSLQNQFGDGDAKWSQVVDAVIELQNSIVIKI